MREHHKLDTDDAVYFYEQEFYVLSNFSAFRLMWKGLDFDTVEHAYHWEKFPMHDKIREMILQSRSAHDAFQIAQHYKSCVRGGWNTFRVDIMRYLLNQKAQQHEYVRRKLLETGDRLLIEDSWRDDFWGWGPDKNGQNKLGQLWMQIRTELNTMTHG